jgi:hypothetical protein
MRRRAVVMLLLPLLAFAAQQQDDERAAIRDWLGETAARLTEDNPGEFLDAFSKELRNSLDRNVRSLVLAAQVSSSIQIHTVTPEGEARVIEGSWYLELRFRALATPNERRQEAFRMRLEPVAKRGWRIVEFSPVKLFDPPSLR